MRDLSAGVKRDHGPDSNARRAAPTARSISSLSPEGTWAIVCWVAGSSTTMVLPLFAAVHFPSMKSLCSLPRNSAAAEPRAGLSVVIVTSSFLMERPNEVCNDILPDSPRHLHRFLGTAQR